MNHEDVAIERLQSAVTRMAAEYAQSIMGGLPRTRLYQTAYDVLRRLQYAQIGSGSSLFAQSLLETLIIETEKIVSIEVEKTNKELGN